MNPQKTKILIGIKKTKSLLAKIQTMVEKDTYCIDIMQQTLAAMGLLKGVHSQLMEGHLASCFSEAMKTGRAAKKQKMVDEILTVSRLSNK
jgi:DNA-binding FrmR family transcriptional regulator